MRTTIEKVRAAVMVGAALVALIVAGFLIVANYKAHRLLRNLPERLGADIQKETNGYTYSQSVKGRTVFTIHAAKATQHKDGQTGLEDVGIVLYGQKDGRADRIYGKQFEYDQKNGVVRAMGEVQLDLQAPAPTSASAKAAYARGEATGLMPVKTADAQPIHVVTSGLVFLQSLGVASTDQPIRFTYQGMTGQARGAAYNSDTGVTTLESEVRLSAIRDGRPTVLTAAHAELDRVAHQVVLRTARYVALETADRDSGTGDAMIAGRMVVHLRADGSGVESAEGSDGVEVASGESRMQAPKGVLRLTAEGRPEMAQMGGGIQFASGPKQKKGEGEDLVGTASTGLAHFDERGAMKTVHLSGGVRARSQGQTADEEREMNADEMDLQLTGEAGGSKRWVQQATMLGNARVTSTLPAAAGHTAGSEEMRGDVLISRWRQEHDAAVLRAISGKGHTEISRRRDGVNEVSRGDHIEAEFGAEATTGTGSKAAITTALQRGNVVTDRTVRTTEDGAAKTETTHATAEQVSYDAASGSVSLTGGSEVLDGGSAVRAERITLVQGTGDVDAVGAVQVTYRQPAASETREAKEGPGVGGREEPIHAVAERAVLRKGSGLATFFGTPKLRARLWQGGSQVEAPVLAFHRLEATLDAYGTNGNDLMPVRTVLASKMDESGDQPSGATGRQAQVLRVQSGRLHYADGLHRAEFSKGVVLEDANGTITCRGAVAVLRTTSKKEGAPAPATGVTTGFGGLSGGGLDKVTATGDVVIQQPGRVATGQQAVYTAADEVFVLTGGGGIPPKVTDRANGSVSGAVLRFRSGDNSVIVEGRAKDGATVTGDGRVHTHTKVKQ